MRRVLIALGSLLTVAFPSLVWGEEKLDYISAGVGYSFYTGEDRTNLDGAFNGELTYGRRFHPNFALRVGLGYVHDGHEGDDVRAYPVTLTPIGIYPRGSVSLFAGVGLGVYPVKFVGRIGSVPVEDRGIVLGGHLLIGASLDVWSSVFIGLEGKYLLLEEVHLGGQRLELDGFVLTTTLGFRF